MASLAARVATYAAVAKLLDLAVAKLLDLAVAKLLDAAVAELLDAARRSATAPFGGGRGAQPRSSWRRFRK